MQKKDIVIVFDCGATNVRIVAINGKGEILAAESSQNGPRPDPAYPLTGYGMLLKSGNKMCLASKKVISKINKQNIIGVTVTTFGVDGTTIRQVGKNALSRHFVALRKNQAYNG